jgi:hypothetical protein
MKTVSRMMIGLVSMLVLVSLACGGAGGNGTAPEVNIPQVNVPAGGVPQATLDAANTRAAELAGQAGDAAATAQAAAFQVATQAVPASETVVAGAEATSVATLEAIATQVGPTIAASDYTMADLEALFGAVQPDGNGSVSVTMTDDQLNSAVAAAQNTGQGAGQIQNLVITFVPGAIIMSGDVTQPIQANLTVTFSPYVSNGVLQFDITQASLGNIQVPPAMLDQSEATLNSTLGSAANQLPANVTLQSVTVGDGVMTFVGAVN